MAIPDIHKGKYIFHFTDARNLDSIIKNGLLCTNEKNKQGIKHQNIANQTIQERRASMDVTAVNGFWGKRIISGAAAMKGEVMKLKNG